MSSEYQKALEIVAEYAHLNGRYKALKDEHERLHERVKDLERQLADAYARIAEMAKGPTITTEGKWPPDGTYFTTEGTGHGNMTVIDNNPKPTT